MKRRDFIGGALAALGALAWGKLPLPEAAPAAELSFPTGTFLYMDGGTLELGLVRDSVVTMQNDFFLYGESFMLNEERVPPHHVTWVTTAERPVP